MHCLAEITHSTLVYKQQFNWSKINEAKQDQLIKHFQNAPTLKNEYLIYAGFKVDVSRKNRIGISWGTTVLNANFAPNRFLLMSDAATWQVTQQAPYNGVKLFEKRGRLLTKETKKFRMAIMALHGRYYFYVNDMNTPVFQCCQRELSLPHGTPQLYLDKESMPTEANMKIWQLNSRYNGELSVADLLQDENGTY